MPSSNKTSNLLLNQWLGTDKPRKDDFNEDNRLVDAAVASAVGQLNSHAADTALHCTTAEKNLWNTITTAGMAMGTYSGSGTATRSISLGCQPKAGIIFAANKSPYELISGTSPELYCYCCFFSQSGSGTAVTLTDDHITILHNAASSGSGMSYKLNQSGVTYVYLLWR